MLPVWPWIDSAERGVLPWTQGLLQSYFFWIPTACFSLQILGKRLQPLFSGSQNPEVLNAAKTRQQKMTADLQA